VVYRTKYNGQEVVAESDSYGDWILVQNYEHYGGTNPEVRPQDDFPQLPSGRLSASDVENNGSNGELAHVDNISRFGDWDADAVRLEGRTTGHSRQLKYFTTESGAVDAILNTSRAGPSQLTNSVTKYGNHDANLPDSAGGSTANTDDNHIFGYGFPMYEGGVHHWAVAGQSDRWEMDDYPGGPQNSTIHRVWIRVASGVPKASSKERFFESDRVYMSGDNANIQNASDSASVTFSQIYNEPVVVAHTATDGGGQPVDDRIANLTGSGCDIFAHEPDQQGHADNTHTYFVCESGVHESDEGHRIEAGVHQTETAHWDDTWDGNTVDFVNNWSSAPVVIATVNTHNNGLFATPAVSNVTTDSFEISLLSEDNENTHVESIGWIAFPDAGAITIDGTPVESGVVSGGSVTFSQSFSTKPDYVADNMGHDGSSSWVRGSGWSNTDISWYDESGGLPSPYGYIATPEASVVSGIKGAGNTTGSFEYNPRPEWFGGGTLNDDWSFVDTLGTATDRVWLGTHAGRNTTSPSNNVLATYEPSEWSGGAQITSFEVYYQETSAQTGHAFNLYDSSGARIFSFGSENPQFWLRDADGEKYQPGNTSNIDAYDTWHRVTINFDWEDGRYSLVFANAETGDSDTITGNINPSDIAYIDLAQEIPGTARGGSADNLWVDGFAWNSDDGNPGYDASSTDDTGGTYSGVLTTVGSVFETPQIEPTSTGELTATAGTTQTASASLASPVATDLAGTVASMQDAIVFTENTLSTTQTGVGGTTANADVILDGILAAQIPGDGTASSTSPASMCGSSTTTKQASASLTYDAPNGVSATRNSDTKVTVSWDAQNTEADRFRVQMNRDGNGWTNPASGATTDASNTSLSIYHESDNPYDSVIGADSSFNFRVRAEGSDTSSSYSESNTVETTAITPSNPRVSRPDSTSWTFTFDVTSDIADYIDVYFREDTGSGYGGWNKWFNINVSPNQGDVSKTVDTTVDNFGNGSPQEDARYQFKADYYTLGNNRSPEDVYCDYGNSGNVYFSDSFESGDFSAWDSTNLGDSKTYVSTSLDGYDGSGRVADSDPPDGSYGAQLAGGDWIQENLGDLSSESDVLVKAYIQVGSLDSTGENVRILWYDGSNWQTLESWSAEQNRQGWIEVTSLVPESYLSTDNRVRFDGYGGSGDFLCVDRVVVSDVLHEYTKPAAPTNPSTTEGFNELTLDWTPQDSFAGNEVFTHEGTSGGFTKRHHNPSWNWTGLKNDQTYEWYPSAVLHQDRNGSIEHWPRSNGPTSTVSTLNAQTSESTPTSSDALSRASPAYTTSSGDGLTEPASMSESVGDGVTETAGGGVQTATAQPATLNQYNQQLINRGFEEDTVDTDQPTGWTSVPDGWADVNTRYSHTGSKSFGNNYGGNEVGSENTNAGVWPDNYHYQDVSVSGGGKVKGYSVVLNKAWGDGGWSGPQDNKQYVYEDDHRLHLYAYDSNDNVVAEAKTRWSGDAINRGLATRANGWVFNSIEMPVPDSATTVRYQIDGGDGNNGYIDPEIGHGGNAGIYIDSASLLDAGYVDTAVNSVGSTTGASGQPSIASAQTVTDGTGFGRFNFSDSFDDEELGEAPSGEFKQDNGSPEVVSASADGSKSVFFPGDGNYHRIRSTQSYNFEPGDKITGTLRYKAESGATLHFGIVWDGGGYDYFNKGSTEDGNWHTDSGTLTVPDGETGGKIWAFNYRDNTGAQWIDEIRVDAEQSNKTTAGATTGPRIAGSELTAAASSEIASALTVGSVGITQAIDGRVQPASLDVAGASVFSDSLSGVLPSSMSPSTSVGAATTSVVVPSVITDSFTTPSLGVGDASVGVVGSITQAACETFEASSRIEVGSVTSNASFGTETATASGTTKAGGVVETAGVQGLSISPEAAAGAVVVGDGMLAFPKRASSTLSETESGGSRNSVTATTLNSGFSEAKPGVTNPEINGDVSPGKGTSVINFSGQDTPVSPEPIQATGGAESAGGVVTDGTSAGIASTENTTTQSEAIRETVSGTGEVGLIEAATGSVGSLTKAAADPLDINPLAGSSGGNTTSAQTAEVAPRASLVVTCGITHGTTETRQATGVASGTGGSVSSSETNTTGDSSTDSISISPPTTTTATPGAGGGQTVATDGGSVMAATTPSPSTGASASIGGGVTTAVSPSTPSVGETTATSLESETVASTSNFGADATTATVSVSAADSMLATPRPAPSEAATTANAEPSSLVSLGKYIDPLTAANPEVQPQTVNTLVISASIFSESSGGSTTQPTLNALESPAYTQVDARGFTSAITWTLKAPATSASQSAGGIQQITASTYEGSAFTTASAGSPLTLLSTILEGEGPLIRTPGVLPYVETAVDMDSAEYTAEVDEQESDSIISETRLTIIIDDVTTDFEPL
jgi:hypothetical protein